MNTSRTRMMLITVALSCLGITAAWAQSKPAQEKQKTEAAGKATAGGSPFTSDCGNDGVMVGIKASTGSLVDSVQAVCAKVDGNGAWAGGQFSGTRAGGSGGGPANLMCDDGWAVTAVFGKSGSLVDSIGVRCGKLGASGGTAKIVSGSASRGPAGGSGGSAFDQPCSTGQIARGISGRAGTLIDQISSVACHNPMLQAASGVAAPQMIGGIVGSIGIPRPATPLLCVRPDKVEAVNFTVNPTQPILGQPVVLTLTIRNLCNTSLTGVGWNIRNEWSSGVLSRGIQENIPAGESIVVTAQLTPTVQGEYRFTGEIDWDNTLGESAEGQRNNSKTISFNLPQVSATPAPNNAARVDMETQVLDVDKARVAGARFNHGVEGNSACEFLGVFNSKITVGVWTDSSVGFVADCFISGGRATPEAFVDFRLKNGWVVKEYMEIKNIQSDGAWRLLTPPRLGSNDPYMKAHLWANRGGEARLILKVLIQGPRGTNPYQ